MTEEELKAIEARLQAATPGPWSDFCESGDWWIETMADDGSPGGLVVCDANDMDAADMALIAAAPTDIAALIAEVRRLRTLIVNYAEAHADCQESETVSEMYASQDRYVKAQQAVIDEALMARRGISMK